MGFNYTPTTFGRWEKAKYITAIKPGGLPSARVHYELDEVLAFIERSKGTRKHTGAS
jgi:hypothetical protein